MSSTSKTINRPSVHQTSHGLLREMLRDALLTAQRNGGAGISSVPWRASAALYVLLGDHRIDRRGRCRCCRGPRLVFGPGRHLCRVLVAARFYLRQPEEMLLCRLASEWDETTLASACMSGTPRPASGEAG